MACSPSSSAGAGRARPATSAWTSGWEILTYVAGHAAWARPQPPDVTSDESLAAVARLVREFHDLTAGIASARDPLTSDIPTAGIPSTGIPSTGIPMAGIPSAGIPTAGDPARPDGRDHRVPGPVPGDERVVCHNDMSPKNTVYRDLGEGLRPITLGT